MNERANQRAGTNRTDGEPWFGRNGTPDGAAWERLWAAQAAVTESTEKLTKAWLERRREGVDCAGRCVREMAANAGRPGEAFDAWRRWAEGALGRMMADVSAAQEHMQAVANAMARVGAEAAESAAEDVSRRPEPVRHPKAA